MRLKRIMVLNLLVSVLMFTMLVCNVCAATVGQQLTSPEAGWKRIDNTDSKFIFSGGWSQGSPALCSTAGSTVTFKFNGSKMRIIAAQNFDNSSDVRVKIDGVETLMSVQRTPLTYQVLAYEKTDLSFGTHIVTITNKVNNYFLFYGIDIDDTGSLLSYSQVTNLQAVPGNTKVTLKWDQIPDATGYVVKWGTTSGSYTNTQTVTNSVYSGYDVAGLTNGTTYYFTVVAVVGGADKEAATEVSATPQVGIPNAPAGLTATTGNAQVGLTWDAVSGAASYNVKRSTTAGGPYVTIANGVTVNSFTDSTVANGTTYYYVVTAINTGGESGNSNEASATPQATGRALLTINMSDGTQKEYDMSITEVNAFIAWYNNKASGTGPALYSINKSFNKGPFTSRKDYIVFDKIQYFEVSEYTED